MLQQSLLEALITYRQGFLQCVGSHSYLALRKEIVITYN